jgi:elongation factor G
VKKYGIDAIRNIGLFGHQGSGKTSLAEAMLFISGGIDRLGRTDDGTAATDFDPEEVKRHISINIGLAPCEWQGKKINVIDVPGYLDFQGEVRSALRAADAAVLVTPAQSDIEVGFETAWELAAERNCPRAVFVNKMDRENADFHAVVERLRARYGTAIAPVQFPIGQADSFVGVVDILHLKAYTGAGKDVQEIPVPDDLQDVVADYREKLIESAAEGDDALLEKYLDAGTLSDEEVIHGLHAGIDAGKVIPVICGSSMKDIGISNLLSLLCEAFPNPTEVPVAEGKTPNGQAAVRKPLESEPFSALVFKTLADPFVGQLTYFRVFSGVIKSDSHVMNAQSGKDERIGQLYIIKGKTQEAVSEVCSGDIGAVAKLSATHTGHTLCDPAHPIILDTILFPKPIYEIAIKARTKVDEDKLGPALQRVAGEDPTFLYRRDPVTFQTVMSGMGETHLNIVVEKLKKYGANVDVIPLKVPYRETIQTTAEGQGKHKKQTGGRGQYGDCWIKLEPLPRGSKFEFVDAIVGGAIPRQYIPAVEKGVIDAMSSGILSGNPVVDVRCTCYDGSYHDVDSSEAAFKMAGILAFNNVAAKANPIILEPMCVVSVTVPEDMMGDVMSDLSGKRGRIIGTESAGNRRTTVRATVPQSEMLRYAIELRSITRGRGYFEIEPSHYEEVPAHIAQQIIAEYQKSREEH